jgi:hypothetical protein
LPSTAIHLLHPSELTRRRCDRLRGYRLLTGPASL